MHIFRTAFSRSGAFFLFSFFHGADLHGNSVGNFLIQASERFFPDDLAGDLPHGLICHGIFVIEGMPFRKTGFNRFQNTLCVDVSQSGYRYDLVKRIKTAVQVHKARKFFPVHGINLVHDKNHRFSGKFQLAGNEFLTLAAEITRLYQPENHIHLGQDSEGDFIHIFAQTVLRLVDARGIQKNNLAAFIRINRLDSAAGRLRFPGSDRDLLSDQVIHESGFPHIRTSGYSDKSALKTLLCHLVSCFYRRHKIISGRPARSQIHPKVASVIRRRPVICIMLTRN